MRTLSHLFENNRALARTVKSEDPADQPAPEYLWIGCAESRLPAGQLVGLPPDQIFVHRNVAKMCVTRKDELASYYEAALAHSLESDSLLAHATGGQP